MKPSPLRYLVLSCLCAGVFLDASPVVAADSDLPDLAQVRAAVLGAPQVEAAGAGLGAATANAEALAHGPQEFLLTLEGRRRTVRDDPDRYREWMAGVSRPIRLPDKARLDQEIGRLGIEEAQAALGDARHETARALLTAWFAWQRARQEETMREQASELLRQTLEIVRKRVVGGDAARLEQDLAQAELARGEAEYAKAHRAVLMAADHLTRLFPPLHLPADLPQPGPEALEGTPEAWIARLLEHNHEWMMLQARVRKFATSAERAGAERRPDPTLGISYNNEWSGAEHLLGVSLSLPLPGPARSAHYAAALKQAQAQEAGLAATRRRLEAEAANQYASAQAAYDHWQRMQDVVTRLRAGDRLMRRAYALGEAGITDLLASIRVLNEAEGQAGLARIDAREARLRLQLDAHELWDFDD
jgi:outer membrane protein, heavy metal efflux system